MIFSRKLSVVFSAVLLTLTTSWSQAQTQAQSTPDANGQSSGYTLRANSRVVLTDVTVTDAAGNPVKGLPQNAFHITDNKKPQTIGSFEENVGGKVPAAMQTALQPGTYSNDYVQHLPPVLNIILLDLTNITLPDQMYLSYELNKFIGGLPSDQPIAVYLRGGSGTFLLQNFTSDRTILLAAVRKAMPRFLPTGREYLSELDTMHQMAVYLAQFPGRKNIIWFSGGSTQFLWPDAAFVQSDADWRGLYDELEQARIAVYPVDARGLTVATSRGMFAQHAVMANVAQATGGQAFYDTNGLLEAANRVIDNDAKYYTLTYSPKDFRFDNKWHNVRITVDGGPYRLSYRTGYFADGSIQSTDKPAPTRTQLKAGGETEEVSPQLRSVPIIFTARVLPSSDPTLDTLTKPAATIPPPPAKRGDVPFSIRYMVPAAALTQSDTNGKLGVDFGLAAIVFNRDGNLIAKNANTVKLVVNPESLRAHPEGAFYVAQQINLQKGDEFLYLAVWDTKTGRLGTLQVSLNVPKKSQ
jgi:VWFA-related protein